MMEMFPVIGDSNLCAERGAIINSQDRQVCLSSNIFKKCPELKSPLLRLCLYMAIGFVQSTICIDQIKEQLFKEDGA